MASRFPIPEDPEASPLSQGPGPLRIAAVVGAAMVVLLVIRFYIWSQPVELTESSYDRPIAQRHFHVEPRDEEFPEGWSVEKPQSVSALAGLGEVSADLDEMKVPSPSEIEELQVSTYRDPAGQVAWIVAVRYRGDRAPECKEAAVRQDHHLAFAWRAGGGTSSTLSGAVKRKARRIKRVRIWAQKMKTLGSAYVQFGLDVVLFLMVSAFGLFLTKYFLITRETDGI